jgi:hypothetical protein
MSALLTREIRSEKGIEKSETDIECKIPFSLFREEDSNDETKHSEEEELNEINENNGKNL